MEQKFTIKSIRASVHDSGSAPGCLPYKITAVIEIPVKEFNKLCPLRDGSRYLGHLAVQVNNAVYDFNSNIPASRPSIDPQGHRRAKNGIKTMEFNYFGSRADYERMKALGFEHYEFKNQEPMVKYGQFIDLMKGA